MTPTPPRYRLCACCGAWLKRNHNGVYRHARGQGRRCRGILAGKVRWIVERGTIPGVPVPELHCEPCVFCGETTEVDPSGLCPSCLGKQQAAAIE